MNLTQDCAELQAKHEQEDAEMKSASEQAEYQKALKELGIEVYYDGTED